MLDIFIGIFFLWGFLGTLIMYIITPRNAKWSDISRNKILAAGPFMWLMFYTAYCFRKDLD